MSRHSANGRPYWRLLKQAANSGRWWNGDGAAAVLRTLSRSGTS